MEDDPELRCHELLLRLAGRLPDAQLWRFRDWLASGASSVLASALPRALLRARVPLTRDERRLLNKALLPAGADPGTVSSILGVDELGEPGYTFTSDSPGQGSLGVSTVVVLGASLRDRQGVGEVRTCWRWDQSNKANQILLVDALADFHRLTGEMQRMLRALGDHSPCVEVIPHGTDLPPYHRAAMAASELVCYGAAEPVG